MGHKTGSDNGNESFKVIVGEFSGSLEALLTIIQKRKMHISDVSLANVTDEYISYVKSLDTLPQGQTAEFVVIAATLLLIKSKSLLPSMELTLEEEESIQDLESRLELYNIYQQARDMLVELLKTHKPLYVPKRYTNPRPITFSPPESGLTVEVLERVITDVVRELPTEDIKDKANINKAVNIKDVMQSLLSRVQGGIQSRFTELGAQEREAVLVNFLALLELVKDGVFLVEQPQDRGEIFITHNVNIQ